MSVEQRLLLSFEYVRSLSNANLVQLCIDGSVTREEGEKVTYGPIVANFEALNRLMRTSESAYTASARARKARNFLHHNAPKKRMQPDGAAVPCASDQIANSSAAKPEYVRDRASLIKHASTYALYVCTVSVGGVRLGVLTMPMPCLQASEAPCDHRVSTASAPTSAWRESKPALPAPPKRPIIPSGGQKRRRY